MAIQLIKAIHRNRITNMKINNLLDKKTI